MGDEEPRKERKEGKKQTGGEMSEIGTRTNRGRLDEGEGIQREINGEEKRGVLERKKGVTFEMKRTRKRKWRITKEQQWLSCERLSNFSSFGCSVCVCDWTSIRQA